VVAAQEYEFRAITVDRRAGGGAYDAAFMLNVQRIAVSAGKTAKYNSDTGEANTSALRSSLLEAVSGFGEYR
jgi:hypothetical protein